MENYGFCFADNSNDSYHLFLSPDEGTISTEGLEFRIKKDLLNSRLLYQGKLFKTEEHHMAKPVLHYYLSLMRSVKS